MAGTGVKPRTTKGTVVIEGHELTITNPDKPLFPEMGISKLLYLQKLIALAPYLLKYTRNRYLTTIRYPHGAGDPKFFYQKNAPDPLPPFVRTAPFQGINYVVLDSIPTLVWLGNLACLEFHPSLHYIGEELPAEWLIDIDPSLEEEPRIMQAARLVGEALDKMGIQSVPKTSGATGVQIYVPIRKGYTFEQLRAVGHFVGHYLVETHPSLFTIERLKKNRGDLIYVDYLQHWFGKTLSAPYTPRARAGATLSTPLLWQEVESGCDPRDFHLLNIEERLARMGDLIDRVPPQSLDRVLAILGQG
ncbi:DNA polymerase domain-containing protein [Gorillibacterium sp. sgz5001074]|uniref:DNA polymerase domain-containing protein n=1 Tax=Gorillibacterium sp. sgz5001074 TaxID=3446695 RepID=UPI003F66BD94